MPGLTAASCTETFPDSTVHEELYHASLVGAEPGSNIHSRAHHREGRGPPSSALRTGLRMVSVPQWLGLRV